jgi:hypothetical protein
MSTVKPESDKLSFTQASGNSPPLHEETHHSVKYYAHKWGCSENTIISWFRNEPGVLNKGTDKRMVLSIPESVAARVHSRRSIKGVAHQTLKPARTRGNPSRVIRLRDLHRRVPKKPRNIIESKASEQLPDGERVA